MIAVFVFLHRFSLWEFVFICQLSWLQKSGLVGPLVFYCLFSIIMQKQRNHYMLCLLCLFCAHIDDLIPLVYRLNDFCVLLFSDFLDRPHYFTSVTAQDFYISVIRQNVLCYSFHEFVSHQLVSSAITKLSGLHLV